MLIKIIAIGKKMPKWVTDAYQEYSKRFPHDFKLSLYEIDCEKRHKNNNIEKLKQKQAIQIADKLEKTDYVIALDENGQQWTSIEFAEKLNTWRNNSQNIAILIGGPDGLSKEIQQQANIIWSLAKLTFPHPLVRVILIEQLYRAISIINNHPYHRE